MLLDSGFRRNDDEEASLSVSVTPVKAGVQPGFLKRKAHDVHPIMGS
jgi:hypothetical protein